MLISGLWRTSTFRLSALLGTLYALGIVLLLGLVYVRTAAYLTLRSDRIIRAEANLLERGGPETILGAISRASSRDPFSRFALYAATGERVAGDAPLSPADLPLNGEPRETHLGPDIPARALAKRTPWGEVLIVARDSRQIVELRHIVLSALIWSGAIIATLGLASGIGLSLRPLARIRSMRAASDAITSGDFSRRLPIAGAGDELDELAMIANRMMDEAERLMIQARTVGEGVAHELRSPLTRLRASLDHAAQRLEADDGRRALLETCVEEADGVLRRFHALLRIAALEARGRRLPKTTVALATIIDQIAELYGPLATERGLSLRATSPTDLMIEADGELIFEALSNLVDNGLKFTPAGGKVRLGAAAGPRGPIIEVADTGPGIAEAERAFVTRRFYRSSRHAQASGHGLGLSLVAAVADMHGFGLEFGDAGPGTVVRIICRARLG